MSEHPKQHFLATKEDAPDIYVKPGQRVMVTFDYMWGEHPRHKQRIVVNPGQQRHLKDFIKDLETGYRNAWVRMKMLRMRQGDNGGNDIGECPVMRNMSVALLHTLDTML